MIELNTILPVITIFISREVYSICYRLIVNVYYLVSFSASASVLMLG